MTQKAAPSLFGRARSRKNEFQFYLRDYVLLPNHLHLLIFPTETPMKCPLFFRQLKGELQRDAGVILSGIFGIDRAINYIAGKVLHRAAAREESKDVIVIQKDPIF